MTRIQIGRMGGYALVVFVLAAMGVGIFSFVVSTDDLASVFARQDMWQQTGPYAYYMDAAIHDGSYPMWMPLTFDGMPYAANPLTMSFYPPHLVRSLVTTNPTPYATHVGLILLTALHFLLAGVSSYAFARTHRLSVFASTVAALAFTFSAIFVFRSTVHIWLNLMVAWTPLVMLFVHWTLHADRWRRRTAWALMSGLVLGLSLLVGFAQMALYMGVLIGGYGVLHCLLLSKRPLRSVGGIAEPAALLALLFLLSGLVAFALFYSAAEVSDYSGRAKDAGLEVVLSPVQLEYTPGRLLQLLAVYPGLGEFRDILACGAVVMVLVIASLTSKRYREVFIFFLLTYAMLDCCLGPPFPLSALITVIAPFEIVQVPRAAILLCFPLAMLAAFGVDAITERAERNAISVVRWLVCTALSAAVVFLVYRTVHDDFYMVKRGFEIPWLAIAAPVGAVLLVALARWIPIGPVWRAGFVLLLIAEIVSWNRVLLPLLFQESALYPGDETILTQSHSFSLDNTRGLTDKPNTNLYQLQPVMNGYDSVHIGAVGALLRSAANERIYDRQVLRECVTDNHRGNLLFKRKFWLSNSYVDGPLPPQDVLFPVATTAFLQDAPPLPITNVDAAALPNSSVSIEGRGMQEGDVAALNKQLAYSHSQNRRGPNVYVHFPVMDKPAKHAALVLNLKSRYTGDAHVMIREYLPGGVRGESSYLHTLTLNADAPDGQMFELPLPDYRKFGIGINAIGTDLEPPFDIRGIGVVTDRQDENAQIEILSYGPNAASVRVNDLPGVRVLTYLDANYPGWRAYVDGERVPIIRSAEAFKAVLVPPGTHEIRFVFRPTRVFVGLGVSALTVICTIVATMWLFWTSRTQTTP